MKTSISYLALISLSATLFAQDDSGYAIGFGAAADNGNGTTFSVLGNYIVNDAVMLSASLATTRADGAPDSVQTRDWEVGGQYDFGPIGVEVYGGQSGDPDDFDSQDLSAGLYHFGDHWRWSVRYLERDIDLILRTPNLDRVDDISVPLAADGWRVGLGYKTEGGFRINASSRWYDYDRDLTLLGTRVIIQRLSPTSLTLATSLLDRSDSLRAEWKVGEQSAFNVSVTRDELAGDLGIADTLSVGFLTPAGATGDLDISVGVSEGSDGLDGNTVFLSVFYLFYGGFN
ncbi:MAG: hypothetical protein AAFN07_07515 [Pseudomonadota bacterium]